jgi:protein SCO1/2
MRIKTLLAFIVILILPILSYFTVKYLGEEAVVMPRRYYADTVLTNVVDGKQVTDTIWHRAKNISLINQLGDTVSLDDIKGKVIVADFFFTRCGSICPKLTKNMAMLQNAIKLRDDKKMIDTSFIQFISFTVDPTYDTAALLKRYADRFGVNHDIWWMLTGDKKTIYDFAFEELKVDKYSDEPISPDFVHTSRFTLLDKERVVRGYYNGLDSADIRRMGDDIVFLSLEKDMKRKSAIFSEMKAIWPIFLIVLAATALFIGVNRKPKF